MGKVAAARRSAADAGTKKRNPRAVATVPKRAIAKRPPPGAELLRLIEQLPPGRYRVIMNVAKLGKRKGREVTMGVAAWAVDVKVPKPRKPVLALEPEPAPAAALKGDPQDDETP